MKISASFLTHTLQKWNLAVLEVVVVLGMAFASMAYSQAYRGTINGRVTDSTGAVIVGAQVQVIDENTKFVTPAATDREGLYSAPELMPNTYDVKVTATGFGTSEQTGVVLTADDIKEADFILKPATASAIVTVTENEQMLQTETADVGSVISPNELLNAPNVNGVVFMEATRVAGVYSNFTQNSENQQWLLVGGGVSGTAVNAIGNYTPYYLNGIMMETPEGGLGQYTGYVPPAVAVQELSILTSPVDAQLGRSNGGLFNAVLKTGTTKLHATAIVQYGDTLFNANTFNANATDGAVDAGTLPKSAYIKRVDNILVAPSFVVTGPVIIPKLYHSANPKTFFMASYEWRRQAGAIVASYTGSVPTVKERTGDFSELTAAANPTNNPAIFQGLIYDPTTTVPSGASTTFAGWCSPNCNPGQRESFNQEYNEGPGANYIPASRINPVAKNLMQYWPQPTSINPTQPSVGNFFPTGDLSTANRYYLTAVSVDHEFNENNKLTVAYLPFVWEGITPNEQFPYVKGVTAGTHDLQQDRKNFGGLIEYTSVLSPTMVLDVRVGGSIHQVVVEHDDDHFPLSNLGMTGNTLSFPQQNFPGTSITDSSGHALTGLTAGNSTYEYSGIEDNSAILNKSFHKHAFKTGFEFLVRRGDIANSDAFGTFSFNTGFTNNSANNNTSVANGGDGVASLLLGYPAGGTATISPHPAYEDKYWAVFVQDDWRITPNLTLNLGMRFDYNTPTTERHNMLNGPWDFGDLNPMNQGTACSAAQCTPPTTGVPQGYHGGPTFVNTAAWPNRGTGNADLGDRWSPRIGAEWHVFPNTVLRGGFATFFAPGGSPEYNTGFSQATAMNPTGTSGVPPLCSAAQGGDAYGYCNLANPYPNGFIQPAGSSLGLSTAVGSGLFYPGSDWSQIKVTSWNVGIEQQLPFQILADIEYHGDLASGLGVLKNWNTLPNCYYYGGNCPNAGNATALNTAVANPMSGYIPLSAGALAAATVPQSDLYVPYPEWQAIDINGETIIPGTRQRLGTEFGGQLFATLTKRMSHGLEARVAGTYSKMEIRSSLLNAGDPITSAFKEDNAYPNRYLVGTVEYDLPKLNVNHVLAYAVNGWRWTHSLNWQAGVSLNVPGGVFPTGISPTTRHQSLTHWFNTCYIPVVANGNVGQTLNGVVNTSPVYGAPTNCQFGEQPAWIQQPTETLNQLNGNPMRGVRLPEIPYYNMGLTKVIPLREGVTFEFNTIAYNVFNMQLLSQGFNETLTSSAFGTNSSIAGTVNGNTVYSEANDPRIIRFEGRISF